MSKVLVTESYLDDIADAIRGRNGTQNTYTPSQMAAAVTAIPNAYAAGDEGKVVDNGALVAQDSLSVSENGTYDTTKKNSVTVNVSGGGGGLSLGIAAGGYVFSDLGLTWNNIAEESVA